jgi:hypothetical protein
MFWKKRKFISFDAFTATYDKWITLILSPSPTHPLKEINVKVSSRGQ